MYHRILYATDLSPNSKSVARRAWELANNFDAQLYFVHVIEFMPPNLTAGMLEVEGPDMDNAKKILSELGKEYMVPEDHQFVLLGLTKTEILKKAKELNIDLIVMGRHLRHGISRLLGSTAKGVLHDAECDVITVCMKE
jgi:nucleotide-binding universal stress UspA family protein